MKDKPSVNRKRQFRHRTGYLEQTLSEVRVQMGLTKKQLRALAAVMLVVTVLNLSGCVAPQGPKPSAGDLWPNSWNITVPTGFTGKPAAQGIWFGISGPIPPWMNPFNYFK